MENAAVGAGLVVILDVPARSVVVGSPARVIKILWVAAYPAVGDPLSAQAVEHEGDGAVCVVT